MRLTPVRSHAVPAEATAPSSVQPTTIASSTAPSMQIYGDHVLVYDRPRSHQSAPSKPAPTRSLSAAPTVAEAGAPPPVLRVATAPTVAVSATPSPLEAEMREIIDGPAGPGETIDSAYRRKEQSLGELFAHLPAHEALALHRRLSLANANDPLATTFGRLTVERRGRLLAFLADARRRDAVAAGRRTGNGLR